VPSNDGCHGAEGRADEEPRLPDPVIAPGRVPRFP
jgi:hypothetical protein